MIARLTGKGTADFPAFGTTTDEWAGSASFGVDVYGDASLSNEALRFFFSLNANKIYGTNIFRDNLGINSKGFYFGQLSLGIVILENIKLSFMVTTFGSEKALSNKKVVVGGQVLN